MKPPTGGYKTNPIQTQSPAPKPRRRAILWWNVKNKVYALRYTVYPKMFRFYNNKAMQVFIRLVFSIFARNRVRHSYRRGLAPSR